MIKENLTQNHKRLSIQLSSDGFSFCTYISNQYQNLQTISFSSRINSPNLLLEEVKTIFEKEELLHQKYDEVILIHHNDLNTLVPQKHFDENLLPEYLKNSVKTFDNDFVSFDELVSLKANNVYIPFVNINNFIFDFFGSFTYLHSASVFIENIQKQFPSIEAKTMFVNVYKNNFQLLVLENNQLVLSNHFNFKTKEDFVYYILFVAEQLKMDPNVFELTLFGTIKRTSTEYKLVYEYVRNVSIYNKLNTNLATTINTQPQENFNLLHLHA